MQFTTKILTYLCGVLLLIAAIGGLLTYTLDKKAKAAVMLAKELEGQKKAAVMLAEKKETERVLLETHVQTQLKIIKAQDNATINQLRRELTKLTLARPANIPETPIEHIQGDLILADDTKILHLEGVVSDLQGALTACGDEARAYQDAITADDARAKELERALRLMSKAHPWSALLLYGKDNTGEAQSGLIVGRTLGIIRVEVVATQHFQGAAVGFSW